MSTDWENGAEVTELCDLCEKPVEHCRCYCPCGKILSRDEDKELGLCWECK